MKVVLVFADGREIETEWPMRSGVVENTMVHVPVLTDQGIGQTQHDFMLDRKSDLARPIYREVIKWEITNG